MKTSLLLALLFCAVTKADEIVHATLKWQVVTNWTCPPPDHFSGWYHTKAGQDWADVRSNCVAEVVRNGRTNTALIESISIGEIRRNWKIKEEKVYEPEVFKTFDQRYSVRVTNYSLILWGQSNQTIKGDIRTNITR